MQFESAVCKRLTEGSLQDPILRTKWNQYSIDNGITEQTIKTLRLLKNLRLVEAPSQLSRKHLSIRSISLD